MSNRDLRRSPGRRLAGGLLYILYVAAFVAVAFFLFEGVASMVVAFRDANPSRQVAERLYCEYDPDLGWISKPGVRVEAVYGPGRNVVTNKQRFRNLADTAARVPPGKARVICSGDSFTFGYGVDTGSTWCQRLGEMPGLDVVNMGQGGYGFDQSYLWYKRDGAAVEHQLHIMAFIPTDFERMRSSEFFGYGKPVLALEGERLVVRNTPVPGGYRPPSWTTKARAFLASLRLVKVLPQRNAEKKATGSVKLSREQLPAVIAAVVADLARINRERGSVLVLALLPTRPDSKRAAEVFRPLGELIREAAARHGAIYFDLAAEMKDVPPERFPKLFLSGDDLPYPGAAGHYTEEGNLLVARAMIGLMERDERLAQVLPRE